MADGERRMLFDIRGRRRHVIKVVYGILAVLMGASLFLVVGPVNIGSLLNTADEVNRNTEIFDEQVERTEQRLRADPQNENILISLTRARINAGRAKSELDPTSGETTVTPKARVDYEKANDTWARYLKAAEGQPNPALASLVSGTAFLLAQNSRTYPKRSNTSKTPPPPRARRQGPPQRRCLDDPRRLRVPRRRQSRRRRRRAQGARPRQLEVGEEVDLQTAHRLRKTVEGNPESQEASRKGRKGQRQGSAGKPARRPRRRCRTDRHPLSLAGDRRVGREGLEPSTLSLRGSCSNQLS